MNTSRQQRNGVSTSADAGLSNSRPTPRRDIALALTVTALLLAAMTVSGSYADPQEPPIGRQAAAAALQPEPETVYFPSQYVNRGVKTTEDWPTF